MNQHYIQPNAWSIIEEGFDVSQVKASESLFSIGNGAMGQRANFEEQYTSSTFQGSYIAGVYYPDKTRVGWWKNGYPEYFAKVLNAPNWIGIDVSINGEQLDLFTCKKVENFRRELNMKEGWLGRSFTALLQNGIEISVKAKRFLSLENELLNFEHCNVINKHETVNNCILNSNIFICDISAVVSECLSSNAPIFLYIPNSIVAVNKNIKNVSQSLIGVMHNQEEWIKIEE